MRRLERRTHLHRLPPFFDCLLNVGGARLIEFVVDLGAAKESADEYPALAYLRNGLADVLLAVRVPIFDSAQSGDLLESSVLPNHQALAWVTVPTLRRLGLLPDAVGLPSFARQRAAELRGRRFTLEAVARWLDTEGYAAPAGGEGWTRADVAKLLRQGEQYDEAGETAHAAP